MFFALGAFALVEGLQFEVVLGGVEGGLEEGGAEGLHAAFAHFDVADPLAALLEAWVVAHKGLEPDGGGAAAAA